VTDTDPWLDERDNELLLRILRTRPASAGSLAELLGEKDVPESLKALREAGFLEGDGDALVPVPPQEAWAEVVSAAIARERASLDALDQLVGSLPALTQAWRDGKTRDAGHLQGEVLHGSAESLMVRWFEVSQERPPSSPCTAYGDIAFVRAQFMHNLDNMQAAFEEGGYQFRLLLPADQMSEPANRDAADKLIDIGVAVRLATTVPSYLYVDAGVMAGFPLSWGTRQPADGIVLVYDPVLVEPATWLFERWWAAATPWPLEGTGWRLVVKLLALGHSDEQIAATLDLGVRTVRRRISTAMEHYGVYSRFELGMRHALEQASTHDGG
jgi:hypothetical protein